MVMLRKPTVHAFDKSFQAAKVYEAELDKHFVPAYDITPATYEQERLGIDRFFAHRSTGVCYSVEYKTDHKTHETGNVFVETMSVDTAGKRGWAYTSTAQVLVYFVPQEEYALRADMTEIKRRLPEWSGYRQAEAMNRGRSGDYYRTLGLLVPVRVFGDACVAVHDVASPLDGPEEPLEELTICIHDAPAGKCYFCSGRWLEVSG